MGRTIITTVDVRSAGRGGRLAVPGDAIVTAAATDLAAEIGVTVDRSAPPTGGSASRSTASAARGSAATASWTPGGATPAASGRGGDDELDARVRAIVSAVLAAGGGTIPAPTPRRPVKAVAQRDVTLERFGFPGPPPGMDVRTADVVTDADGSPMAAGYMTLTQGSFPWTLTYDEIQIVVEGELHLGTADGVRVGRPGDVLYVPKGNAITFGTPTWAKFVYVTFPAQWAG